MRSILVLLPALPLVAATTTSYEVLNIGFPPAAAFEGKTFLGSMVTSNAEAATIGVTCMPGDCGTATIINGTSTFSGALSFTTGSITETGSIDCGIEAGTASCKGGVSLVRETRTVHSLDLKTTLPVTEIGFATVTAIEGESGPTAAPSTSTTNSTSTASKTSSGTGGGATGSQTPSGSAESTNTPDAAAPTKMAGVLGVAGLAVGIAAAAL